MASSFLAPTLAMSGGLERSLYQHHLCLKTGNYVEFTYSNRNYDVTDNMFAPKQLYVWMMYQVRHFCKI